MWMYLLFCSVKGELSGKNDFGGASLGHGSACFSLSARSLCNLKQNISAAFTTTVYKLLKYLAVSVSQSLVVCEQNDLTIYLINLGLKTTLKALSLL